MNKGGSIYTFAFWDGVSWHLVVSLALTLASLYQLDLSAQTQLGGANISIANVTASSDEGVKPDFTASTLSGPAPLTVEFSAVPAGANAIYSWNFTNSLDTPGQTASFTFEEPGEYAVTLKVQSGNLLRTATKIVTVTGGEPSRLQRPYTVDESEVGQSVYIDNSLYGVVYTDSATSVPVTSSRDNIVNHYDLVDATDDIIAMDVVIPGVKEEVHFNARNTVLAGMLYVIRNPNIPTDVSAGFYQNFPTHEDFDALVEEVRAGKQYYNSVDLEFVERLRKAALEVAEKYIRRKGLLPNNK